MAVTKTRIPYGYKIVNGRAQIDPETSSSLIRYFQNYLNGDSMSTAANAAGLTCSKTTYAHLLKRKEYLGDDYYPPLIDEAYQKRLIEEWEKRKKERPRKPRKAGNRIVKVYTDFRVERFAGKRPRDPVKYVQMLYRCVQPSE